MPLAIDPMYWTTILLSIRTTGASQETAEEEQLEPGVEASHELARIDWPNLQGYMIPLQLSAAHAGLPWALLAGIASRESRAGVLLDAHGFGDEGRAYGVCQIDIRYQKAYTDDGPCSMLHFRQASAIVRANLLHMQKTYADWDDQQKLLGTIAAYNVGVNNVHTPEHIDLGTTHNDYGMDVIARAQYFNTCI